MAGQVVRGIGGRRDEYKPIVSQLVDSAEPLAVARAFRDHFGFDQLYLADLDAIQRGTLAAATAWQLQQDGFRLWIDAGITSAHSPAFLEMASRSVDSVIVGLESVLGPDALAEILRSAGPRRVVFSLDLKAGKSLGSAAWETDDPWMIAMRAIELGIERLIVLDLASVGAGAGVGTEELCEPLKQTYPHVQLTAGGGVRGMDDVNRLTNLGVDYVLVASALHDGRIKRRPS
jgi:phosphoribosylformimino-5-aminoimidazole carboxamide ribotide isomerase